MSFAERRIIPLSYFLSHQIAHFLLRLLCRWQITGTERVPLRGPLIVVANHLHFADPAILIASLPRRVSFMAKEELFHRRSRWLIRGVGAFPVRRNQFDRTSFRRAIKALERGMAVGIFPEGRRSPSGELLKALPGAAYLARHCGAPILPVGICGTETLRGFFSIFSYPKITVTIGEPFSLPEKNGRISREELDATADLIMERIARLLPANYQGVYEHANSVH